MQICTLPHSDNYASTLPLSLVRMPFLPPNQQHQNTEGINVINILPKQEQKMKTNTSLWQHTHRHHLTTTINGMPHWNVQIVKLHSAFTTLWSVHYLFPKVHEIPPLTFWVILLTNKQWNMGHGITSANVWWNEWCLVSLLLCFLCVCNFSNF